MAALARTKIPEPASVSVTNDTLSVALVDGRMISVPLLWFPRLFHGTRAERSKYELSHEGIHWPDLKEDICVEGLLLGEKSGESMKSLKRWLDCRARGEKEPILTLPLPPELARYLEKEKRRQKPVRGRKRVGARYKEILPRPFRRAWRIRSAVYLVK